LCIFFDARDQLGVQSILVAHIVNWRENHGIIVFVLKCFIVLVCLVGHVLLNKWGLLGAPLDSKSIEVADVAVSIVVLVELVIGLLGASWRSFAVGIWGGGAWNAVFRHWKGSLIDGR
jgi:hypothetical protein